RSLLDGMLFVSTLNLTVINGFDLGVFLYVSLRPVIEISESIFRKSIKAFLLLQKESSFVTRTKNSSFTQKPLYFIFSMEVG
ncbi:hypothetical protein J4X43_00785, partial [Escherichia coli]